MAEELKKTDGKISPGVILKVILGLVFLILGAWAILSWWGSLLMVIKGFAGLFLFLAGIITLAMAKE